LGEKGKREELKCRNNGISSFLNMHTKVGGCAKILITSVVRLLIGAMHRAESVRWFFAGIRTPYGSLHHEPVFEVYKTRSKQESMHLPGVEMCSFHREGICEPLLAGDWLFGKARLSSSPPIDNPSHFPLLLHQSLVV
jgi:hypothetical protein